MRIGIEASPLLGGHPGGIEGYLAELVTRMPALGRGHEFRLCLNACRPRHAAGVQRFLREGVRARVCRVPARVMQPLHARFGLPADLVYGRLDVMFYACFVLPQRRGRMVVTVHDLIPLTHPELCAPAFVRQFRSRVLPHLGRADTLIAVSAHTGAAIQERLGLAPDRIRCIHNGVHERFRELEDRDAVAAVASRYGVRGPYLLFLGTLEPRKNLVRLVEAFGRAAGGAVRDHTLVLAGQPYFGVGPLRSAIARLGPGRRVLLPGYVAAEDLPSLYAGATAFLFPSLAEGFGIPPLEAMACGCPVLAAAIPALAEVLGDAALAVEPTDVEAIADGIRRLVEDGELRAALRARGRRRAKEFSWDRTAAETLAVLEGR